MHFSGIIDAATSAAVDQAPMLTLTVATTTVSTLAQAVAPNVPGITMLAAVQDELAVLAMSGVLGATFKAMMWPVRGWRNRAMRGASSALSALCLGGVASVVLVKFGVEPVFAFMAGGFLMGVAGKDGVIWAQTKIMGKVGE